MNKLNEKTENGPMIGLSLSLCVRDIVTGIIKEDDVKQIIACTNATADNWDKLLEKYSKTYWRKFPEQATQIAQRLYDNGKIEQPRLVGGKAHSIAEEHWIKGDQIADWMKKQDTGC